MAVTGRLSRVEMGMGMEWIEEGTKHKDLVRTVMT